METFSAQSLLPLLKNCLWFVVLFALSAFCSASETAITTTGRSRLMLLQEKRPFLRSLFQWLIDDVQEALTVCLVANNVVNIAASTLAASLALQVFGERALVYVVPIMTVLVVIFGEILPKSAAMVNADGVLVLVTPVLRLLGFLIAPFVWLMKRCVALIGVLFRLNLRPQHVFVTREEIEQVVKIGEQSGALEAVERRMIDGIIDFEETRVHEVMVPRMDMVTLEASDSLSEAMEVFIEHGHSRLPVYEESLDNIVGILYVKDTLKHLVGAELGQTVGSLMRKPLFVPETIRTVELLETMRRDHVHIAVVVDEYGGVAGLVTMEDILEEIVGEIQDEYDQEAPDILELEGGAYLVRGTTGLEDLSEALNCPFESEDAESLAGLVLLLAGGFPKVDDEFVYRDWRIRVVDLEDHRIKALRLEPAGSSRDD
ncbi:hemolysin family protein [Fretibacterium sp. OH1220_COT-178]|uniref:hemolysin family protein n=1 Tax=Fretibacterium sp. OH1220_COT-178 TaxID=2491047 RepID=UPI000F5E6802|nr:hemolysin family protein [Fretibacterium sp. OH1220_COT-178]RRD65246.1 HlyC/CorC family transporter [Fretibacterium sp. OH1220_COT-178]